MTESGADSGTGAGPESNSNPEQPPESWSDPAPPQPDKKRAAPGENLPPAVETVLANLPERPGVYRMLDATGAVLYVGKAKSLKARVSSYFHRSGLSPRIAMMVSQIDGLEVTVTQSEGEALILENNLIKSLTPRYNILFRDDKSYPYLVIGDGAFPRLGFHRGSLDRGKQYFGPYPHAHAVRESIQLLQRVFQLRTCEDSVFSNRSRPCLLHQIRRCTAPCVGKINAPQYAEDVKSATMLLEGKGSDLIDRLTARMHEASERLAFEQAALFRDQVQSLSKLVQRQAADTGIDIDVDVIAHAARDGSHCINLVMFRGGRQLGDRSFFPRNAEGQGDDEVLRAFIDQHYQSRDIPGVIICERIADPAETAALLSELANRRVQVVARTNGVRRTWAHSAAENAQQALETWLLDRSSQTQRLDKLRTLLDLPDTARRVECFDISHTAGELTVASCVVNIDGEMARTEYRRFNIEGVTPGDDYHALAQAIARRYGRLASGEGIAPDLILIDGGAGQLGRVRTTLAEMGLGDLPLLAISKGPERRAGMEQLWLREEVALPWQESDRPALHLLQEIRDEAHRFAITGHRARRGKKRVTSSLEDIAGVGATRRRALLARFGGLRGVMGASIDDLTQVRGISRDLAERIYKELHAT